MELWKSVPGFEDLYEVSNLGNIRNKSNGSNIKPFQTGKGYKEGKGYDTVSLRGKQMKIHRLVAQAFVPNPNSNPEVNHIDGNKHNNKSTNLEWVTTRENILHAFEHGLMRSGENSPCAKLNNDQVDAIRSLYKPNCRGYGFKSLAKMFNVSDTTIRNIINGKKWRHDGNKICS